MYFIMYLFMSINGFIANMAAMCCERVCVLCCVEVDGVMCDESTQHEIGRASCRERV